MSKPLTPSELRQRSAEALRKARGTLHRLGGGDDDGSDECLLCCEPLRVVGVGECEHRSCCGTCSLRLRTQHRDTRCAVCKRTLEFLFIVPVEEKRTFAMLRSQVWGKVCVGFFFDEASGCFFASQDELKRFQDVLEPKCKDCGQSFPSRLGLTLHLGKAHGKMMCDLCMESRGLFLMELPQFTKAELARHIQQGDGAHSGFQGHPACRFCVASTPASSSGSLDYRGYFYSSDELYKHMQGQHEMCHLCARAGILYHYYKDYDDLQAHYKDKHFACTEPACLERRFVVFESELALQAHMASEHGRTGLAGRPLSVDFVVRGSQRERQVQRNHAATHDASRSTARGSSSRLHHTVVQDYSAEFEATAQFPSFATHEAVRGGYSRMPAQEEDDLQAALTASRITEADFPALPSARVSRAATTTASVSASASAAPASGTRSVGPPPRMGGAPPPRPTLAANASQALGHAPADPRMAFTTHEERANIELLSKQFQEGHMDEHEFYLTVRELVGPVAMSVIFPHVARGVKDPMLCARLWSVHENATTAPVRQAVAAAAAQSGSRSTTSSTTSAPVVPNSVMFPALPSSSSSSSFVRGARVGASEQGKAALLTQPKAGPVDPSRFLSAAEAGERIGRRGVEGGDGEQHGDKAVGNKKKNKNSRQDKELARMVFGPHGGGGR